jgi:hypothetical protein
MSRETPATPERQSAGMALLASAPACLFAAYPLALAVGANAGILPVSPAMILRASLTVIGVTAVLLVLLLPWRPNFVARAMWLSFALLLFVGYGFVVATIQSLGAAVDAEDWRLAAPYTVFSLTVATLVIRPWKMRSRDPIPLNLIAGALFVANVYSALSSPGVSWRAAADALTESTFATASGAPQAGSRDIYYVVLDGFGRADTLRTDYDLDLGPFVAFLRSKGFYVPDRAHSNYSQTFLSLASTLNMNYLDDVAFAIGTSSRDRRPLAHLIRNNALMNIAHHAGYEVVAIGSDYMATSQLDRADVCVCQQHGLDEFEQAAIGGTPLAALPLGRWTHDAHREKVQESFAALRAPLAHGRRTFVFAHIISPHPPFLFGPDGSSREPGATMFGFQDGDHYRGPRSEYVSGYRDQVRFVTGRLTALVQQLLERPGPAPVIVLHGDHGPGSMLHWEDARATSMSERMSIFAAYYFPDDGPPLYATISPVNGVRALASRYLGVNVPFLPEKTSFSTWNQPYHFISVPNESASNVAVAQ